MTNLDGLETIILLLYRTDKPLNAEELAPDYLQAHQGIFS